MSFFTTHRGSPRASHEQTPWTSHAETPWPPQSAAAWPGSAEDLVEVQRELAAARPALWHPSPAARPLVAGCFVCFARRGPGRGRAGEAGWAGAALMHAKRRFVAI